MIERKDALARVRDRLTRFPVVAVLGARQVGKSTLARACAARFRNRATVFDLENPDHAARLREPMLALQDLRGLVVLDEVQHAPDIFRVLRVLADRPRTPARFLVLGSASPEFLRQSSESLAGRIAFVELGGFNLREVGPDAASALWLRGGFPRSFLASSDAASLEWRREFVRTYLERDIPQLGLRVSAETMRRFWTMLAHWHGQVWNASEFASSFGVADTTVRHHLDLLCSTFAARRLLPWTENIAKRQVKSPKVFVADPGILHALLNLPALADLESHPKCGASWEGFAMAEVLSRLGAHPDESFFWATHAGAELDLFVVRGRKRRGFEFKRSTAPVVTKSMEIARADLKLDAIDVICMAPEPFRMSDRVRAVPLKRVWADVEPMA